MGGQNGEQSSGAEVKQGVAWIGNSLKAVQYTVVDGLAVVEGCIILGPADKIAELTRIAPDADLGRLERYGVVIKGPHYRWPRKTVPFQIDAALPDKARVTDAIAHWRSKTSLTFVERKPENQDLYPDYVRFREGSGCASSVGCQGGEQAVMLGPNCTTGNAIHEIGHCVGLWHEQSRSDRDDWVTINLAKVAPEQQHNFSKHINDGVDVDRYDYGSIMHYPRDAFSVDGSDTIVPKQNAIIGQRTALSATDVAVVEAIYAQP